MFASNQSVRLGTYELTQSAQAVMNENMHNIWRFWTPLRVRRCHVRCWDVPRDTDIEIQGGNVSNFQVVASAHTEPVVLHRAVSFNDGMEAAVFSLRAKYKIERNFASVSPRGSRGTILVKEQ